MLQSILEKLGYRKPVMPETVDQESRPTGHRSHRPGVHHGLHMAVKDGVLHYREKSSIKKI